MLLTIYHVTMKTLLLVPGLYTSNSDLWERQLLNFTPVRNFCMHLYQINPRIWERLSSGYKVKPCKEDPLMKSNVDYLAVLGLIARPVSIFSLVNT